MNSCGLVRTDVRDLRRPTATRRGSRYWTHCELEASAVFIVSGRYEGVAQLRSRFITAEIKEALSLSAVYGLLDVEIYLLAWSSDGMPTLNRISQVVSHAARGLFALRMESGETHFLQTGPDGSALLTASERYRKPDDQT